MLNAQLRIVSNLVTNHDWQILFDFLKFLVASLCLQRLIISTPDRFVWSRNNNYKAKCLSGIVAMLLVFLLWCFGTLPACAEELYPPLYPRSVLFTRAMQQVANIPAVQEEIRVSGITVPHHLLAAPLIAEGFARLREQHYDRIIILSPDHYTWGKTVFSVPKQSFSTCFGTVGIDQQAVNTLLQNPLVSASNLFSHEHGVQAILPFIATYFPNVPVVPVALGVRSKQEDWDTLATALAPLLTQHTLIIQSTDFSHYLPKELAFKKDQETLRVLSGYNLEEINTLIQPEHTDSKAAQYLQLKLQKEVFKAHLLVEANANACDFLPAGQSEPESTTSYILQLYTSKSLPTRNKHIFFGGDFFTGRYLVKLLEQKQVRTALVNKVLEITQGAPLVVNFEGVILPKCPDLDSTLDASGLRLCMTKEPTLELMHNLNIVAVSLANNHSQDFGASAYQETRDILAKAGIATIGRGEVCILPDIAITAFTDVDNKNAPRARIIKATDLESLQKQSQEKPLAVMLHYGVEFFPGPGYREKKLAELFEQYGVEIIVGSHAHQSGALQSSKGRVWAWSLGNFLFDQHSKKATCTLLEVVFFSHGTYWSRQHELGNMYNQLKEGYH
ncbi:poly-gamma-glutamate synthesis protein (capsule biosynthesis protein) [Desulfovibrio litoralis DSM 11393]|uniref:Poly-gamma-glutamate synthesis protein (Capsule biosynthesis protein) n=2 Tax=Desulfovibrio litoralis TaxID=466107 RepID=A0A1M7TLH2_9BACT|nr:poly-gamma-glutamate synthesis protein (capsule biosynthesis protein) [Desulfovibrio litoralis DSM 11393]